MQGSLRTVGIFIFALAFSVAGCGGGGSGGGGTSNTVPNGVATPTPTPTPLPSTSSAVATGGGSAALPASGGFSGTFSLAANNAPAGTTVLAALTAGALAGGPAPQSNRRALAGSPSVVETLVVTFSSTVTFTAYPSFALTLPSGVSGEGPFVLELFDGSTGTLLVALQSTSASGNVVSFTGTTGTFTAAGGRPYIVELVTNSPLVATPTPSPPAPTPTPTPAPPTPTPTPASSAFSCPASDGTSAVARGTGGFAEAAHRMPARQGRTGQAPGLIAVTYARAAERSAVSTIAGREQTLGTRLVRTFDYPHIGLVTRVLSVAPAQKANVEMALRAQAGVVSVVDTGARRYTATVNAPYYTNDPYFGGFTAGQNTSAGNGSAPATFHIPPYDEAANVPGQWDMHAIGLDYAFAYSQAGNGSGITNANALGSASIKLAIIDTGADTLHPELAGKVPYQRCFITDPNNVQSTSNFVTDPEGHGTDTSDLATATVNNALGFTGAGGNSSLYIYRVFPTPDDSCTGDNGDDQCGASTNDIASAINDAVNSGVNVISMSLGGGGCSRGQDDDPIEGAAIANAIAANVVVVVAAGNDGTGALEAPACDTGVVAVGATGLADGSGHPNGAGNSLGSPSSPVEYVASYSDYGTTGGFLNPNAWGIVAPGGDPSNNNDSDDLHWIENIWTSTPFDANFGGSCNADYAHAGGTTDCRTLIAGTSMATPHVAGAAALILAVTGGSSSPYQSPAAMKTLLCTTADNLNSNPQQGCGRLNIYRAMAKVLGDPNLP